MLPNESCSVPSILQFLTDLLSKFKKTVNKQSNSAAFAEEVAAGLTQSLESNDEYLQSECPVCLEEPKIADAVLRYVTLYGVIKHMFRDY